MTNYFDNIAFLTEKTSLTPSEIDSWTFQQLELYIASLKKKLEKETASQQNQSTNNPFSSVSKQLQSYFNKLRK